VFPGFSRLFGHRRRVQNNRLRRSRSSSWSGSAVRAALRALVPGQVTGEPI
jgi:hypothetical protein